MLMMSIVYICAKHQCDRDSCQGSVDNVSSFPEVMISNRRSMLINGGPIRSPQVECDGSINHGSVILRSTPVF